MYIEMSMEWGKLMRGESQLAGTERGYPEMNSVRVYVELIRWYVKSTSMASGAIISKTLTSPDENLASSGSIPVVAWVLAAASAVAAAVFFGWRALNRLIAILLRISWSLSHGLRR